MTVNDVLILINFQKHPEAVFVYNVANVFDVTALPENVEHIRNSTRTLLGGTSGETMSRTVRTDEMCTRAVSHNL